jgi:hypothetical protein
VDLLQFQADYTMHNWVFMVTVQVPVIQHEVRMYKLAAIPFVVNDTLAAIDVGDRLILVGEGDRVHIEISTAELTTSCSRHQQVHICRQLNIMRKRMPDTCSAALYAKHAEAIPNRCNIRRWNTDTHLERINSTTYIMTSNKPTSISVVCNRTRTTQTINRGQNEVTIPPTCTAYGDSHEVLATGTWWIRDTVVHQIEIEPMDVPQWGAIHLIQPMMPWTPYPHELHPMAPARHWHVATIVIILGAIQCLVAVACWVGWKRLQRWRLRGPQQEVEEGPPLPRRPTWMRAPLPTVAFRRPRGTGRGRGHAINPGMALSENRRGVVCIQNADMQDEVFIDID